MEQPPVDNINFLFMLVLKIEILRWRRRSSFPVYILNNQYSVKMHPVVTLHGKHFRGCHFSDLRSLQMRVKMKILVAFNFGHLFIAKYILAGGNENLSSWILISALHVHLICIRKFQIDRFHVSGDFDQLVRKFRSPLNQWTIET